MQSVRLDARLMVAAKLVRQGGVLADIGSDHAYLPIFLLESGKIARAVITDIGEGPLNNARAGVAERGLSDKVDLILTDGAKDLSGMGITDYTICGMGGELIAKIIESAPHLFDTGVRLILQPMTKQADLRIALSALGFEIKKEVYTEAEGKFYVLFLAEYTGVSRTLSFCEAELGYTVDREGIDAEIRFYEAKLRSYRRRVQGLKKAKISTRPLDNLINLTEKMIENLRGTKQ